MMSITLLPQFPQTIPYNFEPNFECIRLLLFYSVIFQSVIFQSSKFQSPVAERD